MQPILQRCSQYLGLSLFFLSSSLAASPFEECISDAILVQSAVATAYHVNLSTGEYGLAENDMGTRGKVNAVGFNPNDNYIYGWSYKHGTAARIGSDFQVQPLEIGNKARTNFFVGDVSYLTNEYFVYKRGSGRGLYAIPLDPAHPQYLQMRKVADASDLDMRIFDLAFHPNNGLAYSVDRQGNLYAIDASNGTAEILNDVGEKGTYGAVYFDRDGMLYLSRNKDGNIFRVDVSSDNPVAELFAHGPSSSVNDGARCALAAIANDTNSNIDFGDAPDSYGTYMTDNGARHGLLLSDDGELIAENSLFLGTLIDGESDAAPFPMSDDNIDNNNDDDGVQFATGLIAGKRAVLLIKSSGSGHLNAWMDFQQDGSFDDNDQIITDRIIGNGTNVIFIDVPEDAVVGNSWARFRLSSILGVTATGGAPDGEVEDYQVELTSEGSSVTYYPSSSGWTTLAFEDNWPLEGDFDMNDLVVYLRTATYKTNELITFIQITGEIAAVGAAYHNGFGIRLPGISRSMIDADAIRYTINDRLVEDYQPLEPGRDEAILLLINNVWNYVSAGEDCTFYRTEEGCGSEIQARFEINIPLLEPATTEASGAYDPFLFSTPGAWHGSHYDEPPGRRYEIHVKNQSPTEGFDFSLSNVENSIDGSNPLAGQYYQTTNGLPWALEIGSRWQYPREFRDVLDAYPLFENFVNSNGEQSRFWYSPESANLDKIFVD